jgi:hypothetical protein
MLAESFEEKVPHPTGPRKILPPVKFTIAVQDRHKSSDPCCKRELCVPRTGSLSLRSAAVS